MKNIKISPELKEVFEKLIPIYEKALDKKDYNFRILNSKCKSFTSL